MRLSLLLFCAIACLFLAGCKQESQTGAGASNLVVTGERGGNWGGKKGVRAGTAATVDASDTYVFVLLIKDAVDQSTTIPPPSDNSRSIVDQGAGVIETTGSAVMNTRFSLSDQTLVINKLTVDLKRGSIVVIELAADGKITLLGQCKASAPFKEDAVDYVESLKSQCVEIAEFLKD